MAHNLISSNATIKAVKPGDARWRLDKLVSAGIDPSTARKQAHSEAIQRRATERRAATGLPPPDSFEAVAREWHKKIAATWAPSQSIKIIRRLEQDVFPWERSESRLARCSHSLEA